MIVDDKYSLFNINNLTQPIEMQLCKKQKSVSDLFSQFFKSRLISKFLKNKMNLAAYVLTKLCILKGVVRQMSKKTRFRRLCNKQHVKRSQILLKSV